MMLRSLALLLAVVSSSPVREENPETLFNDFVRQHNKTYRDEVERVSRMTIFLRNHELIRTHNAEAEQGKHTFTMAMNQFGDLTPHEFRAFLQSGPPAAATTRALNSSSPQIDSIDWVAEGAVTPVKDQGALGKSWAFAVSSATESAWFIEKGTLYNLSPQQLSDCVPDSDPEGAITASYEFLIDHGGCNNYPANSSGQCSPCEPVVRLSGYVNVAQSEFALKQAVTSQPVVAMVEADQPSFMFYSSGVMTGDCGNDVDHTLVVVGFGDLNGTPYWKLKNSWGASWGMNGYMLLGRGIRAPLYQCGIVAHASYPTV